jgi:hypothetical protein
MKRIIILGLCAATIVLGNSCAHGPGYGPNTHRGVVDGAIVGASIGAIIGDHSCNAGEGALIGAGIGALLGGSYGHTYDQEEYYGY